MQPCKLDVMIALFCYGGNGGIRSIVPEIGLWLARLASTARQDERIGRFDVRLYGDVPLTMERNRAALEARDGQYDVLLMIDSDNVPDLYLGHRPWARAFWDSSFDFIYGRLQRGLPSVVCAPYCGPPPHPTKGGMENVYVFRADRLESGGIEPHFRLEAYDRQTACQMRGIQPIAAGPTGLILYTTSAFGLMPVGERAPAEVLDDFAAGRLSKERALRLLRMQSWFFYEFTDQYQTRKASTEDVTNTREIQFAGVGRYGGPVVFCNWDAWAGHMKPKCVGMPEPIRIEQIADIYLEAVAQNIRADEELREVEFELPPSGAPLPADAATDAPLDDADGEPDATPEQPAESPQAGGSGFPSGVSVAKRMIAGRPVVSIGNHTPDQELNALSNLVNQVALRNPERPLRIIEVGSWVGETALAMHAGLGPAGGTIFCVDHWRGTESDRTGWIASQLGDKLFDYFRQNVGPLLDRDIKVIRGESRQMASDLDMQHADLVFIDADHTLRGCLGDLRLWWLHVRAGGVLCGHDYCDGFRGVKGAVEIFFPKDGSVPFEVLPGTTIWVAVKPEHLDTKDAA